MKKRKSYCKAALLLCAVFSAVVHSFPATAPPHSTRRTPMSSLLPTSIHEITEADVDAGIQRTNNFVSPGNMSQREDEGIQCESATTRAEK